MFDCLPGLTATIICYDSYNESVQLTRRTVCTRIQILKNYYDDS